ncbi:MAG: hypothetical protein OHK0017_09310 [Patescibacteria group bacterium]
MASPDSSNDVEKKLKKWIVYPGLALSTGLLLAACNPIEGIVNAFNNIRNASEPVFEDAVTTTHLNEFTEFPEIKAVGDYLRTNNKFREIDGYDPEKFDFSLWGTGIDTFTLVNTDPLDPSVESFAVIRPIQESQEAVQLWIYFIDPQRRVVAFVMQRDQITPTQKQILVNGKGDKQQINQEIRTLMREVPEFCNQNPDNCAFIYRTSNAN